MESFEPRLEDLKDTVFIQIIFFERKGSFEMGQKYKSFLESRFVFF